MFIKVNSGNHRRSSSIVTWGIKAEEFEKRGIKGDLLALRREDGRLLPLQKERGCGGEELTLSWILDGTMEAGEERKYEVVALDGLPKEWGKVTIESGDETRLDIRVEGDYFASYETSQRFPKPFLGPVIGPYGDEITRLDMSIKEHPHHRSIWVSHGDVNGIDVWNELEGVHGRELHRTFLNLVEGCVFGKIVEENLWTDFSGANKLLDETREIKIYNLSPQEGRIIDIIINFKATAGRVIFGPSKEAGPLGIRVAPSMTVSNGGRIENSFGGINEGECWGKRAQWCDYTGDVNGKRVGIAIFDHPGNPSHPTYWHVRNYGLMAPNIFYFSGKPLVLEEGQELVFRYRIYIHAGNALEAGVREKYHDYVNPPSLNF